MKKFRFLFVVAVIAAIFVLPSFAAEVEVNVDNFYLYHSSTFEFLAPSLDFFNTIYSDPYVYIGWDVLRPNTSRQFYAPRIRAIVSDSPIGVAMTQSPDYGTLYLLDIPETDTYDVYVFDRSGAWVVNGSYTGSTSSLSRFPCVYSNHPLKGFTFDPPVKFVPFDGVLSINEPFTPEYGMVKISDSILDTEQLASAIGFVVNSDNDLIFGSGRYNDILLPSLPSGNVPFEVREDGTYMYVGVSAPFYYWSPVYYPLPDPMGEIMDSTTSIFDSGLSMMASVANAVTSSPLILLIVLIPLIFVGVSLFRRFLKI